MISSRADVGDHGRVPSNPKSRPTIYDVAERAGVSKSLVSMVMRGSPGVSERRTRAVLAAVEELNYRPSAAAAQLAGRRTRTIGMVIDDFENLWFVELLRGMREVLEPVGFQVIVGDQQMTAVPGGDAVDAFVSMQVEGLVLALDPPATIDAGHGVPIVVAGERGPVPDGLARVANDDALGARLATQHLIDLGHRTIVHVTGVGGAAAARRVSYDATMADAGLEPLVVGEGELTTEGASARVLSALLERRRDVTAVFAANDVMALGCLGALRAVGLSVPDDVSLMGYDNSPLAQTSFLDLTSVDNRNLDVGRETGRVLLDLLAEGPSHRPPVLLEPALVPRSTTRRHAR